MSDIAKQKEDDAKKETLVTQRRLLPIAVIETYPSQQGTLNLELIGTGANGKDYAIKTTKDRNSNGFIPATEVFCYELAYEVSIPTPEYSILQLRDGSLAFGSVWEGGVKGTTNLTVVAQVLSGDLAVKGLKAFLSRAYALDLFINNIDRHFGNYLIRESYNSHIILAYDFSLAWYAVGTPYGYEAQHPQSNTQQWHKVIVKAGYFDVDIARNTLTEISKIEPLIIEQILSRIPSDWLSMDIKKDIVQWWASSEMLTRVNRLKMEI